MNYLIEKLKDIDVSFCNYLQTISPEKPGLIVFNFHKIFKNINDISMSGVDPQQGTTVEDFELFIQYFRSAGYIFVHPDDIPDELDKSNKYILITFDDGYYNNIYVLPLLKKYKTPAIFFIASNNVINNEAYWWDIVYRLNENWASTKKILLYKKMIKRMNPFQAKEFLKVKLPPELFKPKNEYDRPFTIEELKDFANEQYVIIGNHTADHAILTNCSRFEASTQIERAQIDLKNITGKTPRYFSYPNGNYSDEAFDILKELNLKLAFTMIRKKNFLPLSKESNLFKIKRFMFPKLCNIGKYGVIFRSNYSLYNSSINLYSNLNSLYIKLSIKNSNNLIK